MGLEMKKTPIASIVGFLFLGYVGLSIHAVSQQGIEQLLICADRGGMKIPFSRHFCREYLFAFRGSRQDIDVLHQGIGALFVAQGESAIPEREQMLKFLIGKGLDVNRADMHELLPLHGAVLVNSVDEIRILLNNGANPLLKDNKFGLTPLELALKLQGEDKMPDNRDAVISLLKNAKYDAQPISPADRPQAAGR